MSQLSFAAFVMRLFAIIELARVAVTGATIFIGPALGLPFIGVFLGVNYLVSLILSIILPIFSYIIIIVFAPKISTFLFPDADANSRESQIQLKTVISAGVPILGIFLIIYKLPNLFIHGWMVIKRHFIDPIDSTEYDGKFIYSLLFVILATLVITKSKLITQHIEKFSK